MERDRVGLKHRLPYLVIPAKAGIHLRSAPYRADERQVPAFAETHGFSLPGKGFEPESPEAMDAPYSPALSLTALITSALSSVR